MAVYGTDTEKLKELERKLEILESHYKFKNWDFGVNQLKEKYEQLLIYLTISVTIFTLLFVAAFVLILE